MTVEQPAHITPLKAIRKKCLDCSCWQPKEVKECPVKDCPLYRFRLGRNPNIRPGSRGNPEISTLRKKTTV
ncbi:MAG: hypothetical protein C4589_02985 [Peptococcaceae bacterium]|nr:MAG: hypothetical protein C4589_02985 [Peptococcaceae bacterium]